MRSEECDSLRRRAKMPAAQHQPRPSTSTDRAACSQTPATALRPHQRPGLRMSGVDGPRLWPELHSSPFGSIKTAWSALDAAEAVPSSARKRAAKPKPKQRSPPGKPRRKSLAATPQPLAIEKLMSGTVSDITERIRTQRGLSSDSTTLLLMMSHEREHKDRTSLKKELFRAHPTRCNLHSSIRGILFSQRFLDWH